MTDWIQRLREAIFDHATILGIIGLFVSVTAGSYGLGFQIGNNREDYFNDKISSLEEKIANKDSMYSELNRNMENIKIQKSSLDSELTLSKSLLFNANSEIGSLKSEIKNINYDAGNSVAELKENIRHLKEYIDKSDSDYTSLVSRVDESIGILVSLGGDISAGAKSNEGSEDEIVYLVKSLKNNLENLEKKTNLYGNNSSYDKLIDGINSNYNAMYDLLLRVGGDVFDIHNNRTPNSGENEMEFRTIVFSSGKTLPYKNVDFSVILENGKLVLEPRNMSSIINFSEPQIEIIDNDVCFYKYVKSATFIDLFTYCPSR